jgi:hypothetical protein
MTCQSRMSWRPRRHCLPRHDDPRWIQLDRICIGGCSNVTTPSLRRRGVRNCAGDVDQPADGIGRAIDAWLGSVENHPFAWRMRFRDTVDTAEVAAIRCEVAAQSRAAALPLLARRPKTEQIPGTIDEALSLWPGKWCPLSARVGCVVVIPTSRECTTCGPTCSMRP